MLADMTTTEYLGLALGGFIALVLATVLVTWVAYDTVQFIIARDAKRAARRDRRGGTR